jgi:hypothetical protein
MLTVLYLCYLYSAMTSYISLVETDSVKAGNFM